MTYQKRIKFGLENYITGASIRPDPHYPPFNTARTYVRLTYNTAHMLPRPPGLHAITFHNPESQYHWSFRKQLQGRTAHCPGAFSKVIKHSKMWEGGPAPPPSKPMRERGWTGPTIPEMNPRQCVELYNKGRNK